MCNSNKDVFQYVQLKSFIHPTFWHKLSELKIDVDKLCDAPRSLFATYTNVRATSCILEVDCSSFNSDFKSPNNNFMAYGTIYNKNTIEEFKDCDKTALLSIEGKKLLDDIVTGRVLEDPRLLSRFFILSFADLKVHKYYYWFAFPAPLNPIVHTVGGSNHTKLTEIPDISNKLSNIYFALPDDKAKAYFIVKFDGSELKYLSLKEVISIDNLSKNFTEQDVKNIYFCFSDPSDYENPSWFLRLYIAFIYITCPYLRNKEVQFIGLRTNDCKSLGNSLLWNVKLTECSDDISAKFIGWEPNMSNKMLPRVACMADSMDPKKLIENSMNLNLKLMKWRLVEDLNLEVIAETKCLLFGAGTLGCAVARNLLAWGFKTITFVDCGHVSFSNPVRQCLYRFEDVVGGKKLKAPTAAERIKEIYPNAISSGHVIKIPMPGHTIGESLKEETDKSLKDIEELINSHDVLFLLTDSRESRWLPTLLGAFHKKIVINAALGFDSYLVMRHGSHKAQKAENLEDIGDLKCLGGAQLGCYFCNDVTAPGNSMKDRTLDQQCTVTRPGVSNIAASYAVELLVALLQHEQKDQAPAYFTTSTISEVTIPEGLLGIIPHSIRGFISTYENILPASAKFSQCIACSEKVLNEYDKRQHEFLYDVFASAKYLEDLTGISELKDFENEIIECGSDEDWSD